MTTRYQQLELELKNKNYIWLVTGVAGFIGSHLAERLLSLGQTVIGVDNFATGKKENLELVRAALEPAAAARFTFIQADVADKNFVEQLKKHSFNFVLHQAALGSVPRSVESPVNSHRANVEGFLNILEFCRAQNLPLVYASSSSVYGDHPALPKVEGQEGQVLSPYAATKAINELYAGVWYKTYQQLSIGLRYFNVFGPRQDPAGAYAAVIPRWLTNILAAKPCQLYGDGETSRDFCYIENVVQANILAAFAPKSAWGQVYNVACGEQTCLNT